MLKKYLLEKWSNPFVKNLSYLISGTFIAQLLGLSATPILSRLYSPSDFGLLGSIVTIGTILATTSTLRYEMGIVLAKSDHEAKNISSLAFQLLLTIVSICFITLFIFPDLLLKLGIEKPSIKITSLICLFAFALGLRNILMEWLTRVKKILLISKRTVLDKLSALISQLFWAILIGTGFGLIYGNVIGLIFGNILMYSNLRPYITKFNNSFTHRIEAAKRYYRFALYLTPQNLLNTISQGLPIFMLGNYFGKEEIGAYFFTVRILQLPTALIGAAIKRIFYKEAAALIENPLALQKKYLKISAFLLVIITIPIIIIHLYGAELFSYIFGKEWERSGEYAQWLFIWIGIGFINPPSMVLYNVLNKQRIFLIFEIILFLIRYLALYIGGTNGDIILTIKLFSCVGIVFNLIFIGYSFIQLRFLIKKNSN